MAETLLDRFLRYVQIETTSDHASETTPSTKAQWVLLNMLAGELKVLGAKDVRVTSYGYVLATIPATSKKQNLPIVAFLAHVDTAPDFSGAGVKPIVHKNWDGKPIVLPDDRTQVIDPAVYPDMVRCVNKDLVTASGTTLLGADDKAGVAIIMSLVEHLLAHPEIEHGEIRVCFNPDEEIGRGVEKLQLNELNADVAYTLDGESPGEVNWETFSGDSGLLTIEGVSTHPGEARKRKMVNALKLAARMVAMLPTDHSTPETTEGREGYIHPVGLNGNVARAELRFILRDHDDEKLREKGEQLQALVKTMQAAEPRAKFTFQLVPSYRNMGNWLKKDMTPVLLADEAMKNLGLVPLHPAIRGGTDGSRLTERGLPTPNLFNGSHNWHGPHEYVCVQDMELALKVVVELAQLWAKKDIKLKRMVVN